MIDEDAALALLKDWHSKRFAETERAIAEVYATFDRMMEKATDGANGEEVLSWCRERIDVPPKVPLPHGRVTILDLKQWAVWDAERRIKEADAWLRAYAEKYLTTVDADLQ